jgi:bile acid:Na+ symporter, BASS family
MANIVHRLLEVGILLCTCASLIAMLGGTTAAVGGWLTCSLLLAAARLQLNRVGQPFAFSCWVLACVVLALWFPATFLVWHLPHPTAPSGWQSIEVPTLISPLIQLIMFGMGTTLSLTDFARILKLPTAVLMGMALQFLVMPLLGFGLAWAAQLPPEVAAGVVLIGSCPGGVASNVITYLAKGDVALSVTMTACSTLLSPLMTPLMMRLLAGSFIDVDAWSMLWAILTIVIVPIAAGLVANALLQRFHCRGPWVDRLLSAVAMLSICIVVGIIVAQSQQKLLTIGPLLVVVAIVHNGLGLGLGYLGAKCCRFDEAVARTISIEVGMQNGGMAAALATTTLGSPAAALAAAIFGPWMNISGSLLASWWRGLEPPAARPQDGALDDGQAGN